MENLFSQLNNNVKNKSHYNYKEDKKLINL